MEGGVCSRGAAAMTDSAIRLAVKLVTTLVVAGECHSAPQEEPACRPAADLRPQASAGNPASIPSDLTPNGTLLRWTAGAGETLKLQLFTAEPGTYELSLSAVHAPDAPVVSAKLWEDPLTRKGDPSIALQWVTGPTVRAVRFDDVLMGPGHHILQLTCLEPGDILLDCVALRRTGELVVPRGGDATGGRPFLGIEMADTGKGGVTIQRTVSGSGAEEAGLDLVSMTAEEIKVELRGVLQYQVRPIFVILDGPTDNVQEFLAILHNRVPVVVASSAKIVNLDTAPSTQIQLRFYLFPEPFFGEGEETAS